MVRKATSQDVADLAGVSRSAVSLVLNGRGAGNIAPAKQARIVAAARKLDYSPNAVALSLRSRRSSTIGVVTDAITMSAFGGRLLQGASDAAAEAGYLLLVMDSQDDADREREAYETLRNRQVDGFLFAAMSLRPYTAPDLLTSTPSALANCFEPESRVPAFVPDEVTGSRTATEHLIARGHRALVMLSGTHDVIASGLREQGFAEAVAAAGLTVPPPVTAGWEIDKGYAAAAHVLADERDRPTAVVCSNDRLAVGVVLAAARLGLAVPDDLSVVGYDDDENVAPRMVPGLTTVRLPHREMGERAMAVVLDAIHDGKRVDGRDPAQSASNRATSEATPVRLACPLVVRDSVAAPRERR